MCLSQCYAPHVPVRSNSIFHHLQAFALKLICLASCRYGSLKYVWKIFSMVMNMIVSTSSIILVLVITNVNVGISIGTGTVFALLFISILV